MERLKSPLKLLCQTLDCREATRKLSPDTDITWAHFGQVHPNEYLELIMNTPWAGNESESRWTKNQDSEAYGDTPLYRELKKSVLEEEKRIKEEKNVGETRRKQSRNIAIGRMQILRAYSNQNVEQMSFDSVTFDPVFRIALCRAMDAARRFWDGDCMVYAILLVYKELVWNNMRLVALGAPVPKIRRGFRVRETPLRF